jgi:hypothetical protein
MSNADQEASIFSLGQVGKSLTVLPGARIVPIRYLGRAKHGGSRRGRAQELLSLVHFSSRGRRLVPRRCANLPMLRHIRVFPI